MYKKISSFLLGGVLAVSCIGYAPASSAVQAEETSSTDGTIRILFTHDLHDHILPFETETNGTVTEIGGYASLKTAIDEYRTDNSLLLDAGDFSMGTLFNGIYTQDAPDLSLLGDMGYDAVTLGNHEFDYGPEELAQMLESADNPPQLLCSNMVFSEDEDSQTLKKAYEDVGGKDYIIKEVSGVKVGIFGIMGEESVSDISNAGSITFDDEVETAKTVVQEMKADGAEFIVAISHSGTNSVASKSEDEIMANSVDGIDVIVSGHSHTTLEEPIIDNGTVIVSSGCYGKYLGVVDINISDHSVADYQLVPITSDFAADETISAKIDTYKEDVQKYFLDDYGLDFDETVTASSFSFDNVDDDYFGFGNLNTADLITDSYLYAYQEAGGTEQAIGIGAKGIIRDNLYAGDITLGDVYNVVSLGKGKDGLVGYPLAVGYVYGSELRELCEIDCSIGKELRQDVQLYFSGMKYTYSESRVVLNRVEDVYIENSDGSWSAVDDNQLYPVVCNYYMAQMMPAVTDMSYGLLSITIKDSSGNPINDLQETVLHDADGKEVKEWTSLVSYLKSLGDTVPDTYQTAREGKTAEGFNLLKYFSHTSKVGWIIYGVIIALVLIIVLIVLGIRKLLRKRKLKRQKAQS
ncbi:MAG: bifunctional metallophosphatase/5'-nucleotidase [Solobacterium sp.]|jgi:2',3'-cyclic-nucleotide 2'-phosphodiesterase (5'-nucleotidase family)|nr:bifunctional metallophosphatase/5'-nucleotidase [Solobacterium sp.]MCH4266677.1 bifunctional metallophosphatase/5'-nucleotidase [Solobacterium sp.]